MLNMVQYWSDIDIMLRTLLSRHICQSVSHLMNDALSVLGQQAEASSVVCVRSSIQRQRAVSAVCPRVAMPTTLVHVDVVEVVGKPV